MSRIFSTLLLAGICVSAGYVASAQTCPGLGDNLSIVEGHFEIPGLRADTAPMGQTGTSIRTVFQPGRVDLEQPTLVLTTSEPVPIGCVVPLLLTLAGQTSSTSSAAQAFRNRFAVAGPISTGEGTNRVEVNLNLVQSSTSDVLIDAELRLSTQETPKPLRFRIIPPEIASFEIDPGTHVAGQPVAMTVTLPYRVTDPMPVTFSTLPSQAGTFTMERGSNPQGLAVMPGLNPTATRFIFTPNAGTAPGNIVLKVSGPDRRNLQQTLTLTSGLTGSDGTDSGTTVSTGPGIITSGSTSGSSTKPGTSAPSCTLESEILPGKLGLQRVIDVRVFNTGRKSCAPLPLKFVAYPTADPKVLAKLKPTPVKGPEKTPSIMAASIGLKAKPGEWTGRFSWPSLKTSEGITFELILGDGKSPELRKVVSFTSAELDKMK